MGKINSNKILFVILVLILEDHLLLFFSTLVEIVRLWHNLRYLIAISWEQTSKDTSASLSTFFDSYVITIIIWLYYGHTHVLNAHICTYSSNRASFFSLEDFHSLFISVSFIRVCIAESLTRTVILLWKTIPIYLYVWWSTSHL